MSTVSTEVGIRLESGAIDEQALAPSSASPEDRAIAAKFSRFSDRQLERKEKLTSIGGGLLIASSFGSILAGGAASLLMLKYGDGSMLTSLGLMLLGPLPSVGGLTALILRSNSRVRAMKLREARKIEDWERESTSRLKELFDLELDGDELKRLGYPRVLPEGGGTIRYGTIEKLIIDPELGKRLEELTLIWSDGEFHILRTVTDLANFKMKELP